MRSLFLKIFFSFWLTIVLMGVPFYFMGLKNRPEHPFSGMRDFSRQALAGYGGQALAAWRQGGQAGLRAYVENIEQRSGISLYLFAGPRDLLAGRQTPAQAAETARRILTGAEENLPPRPGNKWLGQRLAQDAGQDGQPLVIVLQMPEPPPHPPFPFMPHGPWDKILLYSLAGGLVCYFLARSLTAPIRKLRQATKRLAGGDFSVRVARDMGGKGNELADLGRDFDTMAERIEGLLLSRKRLLRDISHELRSPLARLNVALELARQRAGGQAGPPLDRIEKESARLNELIGHLITLTVLESGARDLEKSRVDLGELLREITADADFEAGSRNRRVALAAGCAAGAVMHGSREFLRRAFENVIRNAVRYTRADTEVEISCSTATEGETRLAVIAVRDHGPGAPPWCLQHLFKPFFRVAESRDRQSGGTGLGLAIAERAVRLHGGSMSAVNADGGGLLVTIALPLAGGQVDEEGI
ncbi:MAG: HAMP domain-containing protein [Desulfurivibrio sp.]|nr:MAG: HAMP domain-containing protein [Desulfurivibrio sp.]